MYVVVRFRKEGWNAGTVYSVYGQWSRVKDAEIWANSNLRGERWQIESVIVPKSVAERQDG